jgi:hypothetical protein
LFLATVGLALFAVPLTALALGEDEIAGWPTLVSLALFTLVGVIGIALTALRARNLGLAQVFRRTGIQTLAYVGPAAVATILSWGVAAARFSRASPNPDGETFFVVELSRVGGFYLAGGLLILSASFWIAIVLLVVLFSKLIRVVPPHGSR